MRNTVETDPPAELRNFYGQISVRQISSSFPANLNSNTQNAFVPESAIDSDGDGYFDHIDIDADDDGIPDNVEAQTTANYIAPSDPFTDANGDGLDDNYDSSGTQEGLTPVDTDRTLSTADNIADYLDSDSDNDGRSDLAEAGHTASNLDADADSDRDGLKDIFEGADLNDTFDVNDEIDAPLNSKLPDTDLDAAAGIPLIADLDYRDRQTPPIIDLNSAGSYLDTDRDFSGAFTEGDNPVNVADVDADVRDFAENDLIELRIAVAPPANTTFDDSAEFLQINTLSIPITIRLDADFTNDTASIDTVPLTITYTAATGELLIFSSDRATPISQANLDNLVRNITYENRSQNPTNGDRTLTFTVTDSDGEISPDAVSRIAVSDVNDPPVATDDSDDTNEDIPITINILANDSDVDGTIDPTSVIFVNQPNGSTISADSKTLTVPDEGTYAIDPVSGSVTFTPVANYNGTPTPVEYQITDDDGLTDIAQIAITVDDVNDPPVARDDSDNTNEDTAVTIDILDNDNDSDGTIDPTSVIFVNQPNGSTLSADGKTLTVTDEGEYVIDPNTAEVTFTPVTNYNGTATPVEYQITDDDNDTDIGALTITVDDINDPPIARDDSGNTNEDTAVTIDILDNDNDIDGTIDPTSVIFVNQPNGSTLSADDKTLTVPDEGTYAIDPNTGLVTFTPVANYNGTATPVEYQITDDDGLTDIAQIAITVNDVNDPPVATDDSGNTNEDTAVTIDILDNDSDVDGTVDPTSVIFVNQPNGSTLSTDGKTLTVPDEGTYAIDPTTGLVTFTPVANYNGTPTPVEYQITDDDGLTDIAQIAITVNDINDPPVARDDNNDTDEDTAVTIDILANDSDVDGTIDPTSVIFINQPNGSILSADDKTLTVPDEGTYAIDPTTGLVTFTPEPNYNGTATPVEYQVADDDGLTATAIINLTVNDVNDPPVAENDTGEEDEDTAITINVLNNDEDVDGTVDPTSVIFINRPNGSTISADRKNLTVPNEGRYAIDPTTGLVTFTPEPNYNGTPTPVEYQVADDDGLTTTATIDLTINDVNDPPVAENDSRNTTENTAITINVLNNDEDVDGTIDPTSVVFVNRPNGSIVSGDRKTLTVPGEGEYAIDPTTGLVTFTPELNYNGILTPVQYQITDNDNDTDIGQIDITITDVNNPPVAANDTGNTPEDTAVTINILDNDEDVDGTIDPTSVVFVNRPNGSIVSSDRKTLTVPGEGEYAIDPTTGLVTFTPELNYNGTPTPVEYRVADDDGDTDIGQIDITVTDVNDPPVAADDTGNTPEDTAVTINILDNDNDIDGTLDPTSVVFVNEPTGSIVSGDRKTLTITGEGEYVIDPDTGLVTFTPEPNYNGTATPIEYRVTDDDGATDIAQINITVSDFNDLPVAVNDSGNTLEDTPVEIDILANDSDLDGTIDPTSVIFVNRPNGSSISGDRKTLTVPGEGEYVVDSATGLVTFMPEPNYNGAATPVQYQVADDDGLTATAIINLTVTDVNDPPVAVNDNSSTPEDTAISIDILDNDEDVDGTIDPTSVIFVNEPTGSILSGDRKTLTVPNEGEYVIDPDTGSVTFTPFTDYNGTPTPVEYQVTDDDGATDIAQINITVNDVNDPPVAANDSGNTPEDTAIAIDILASDRDPDGTLDPTSVIFINEPTGSTISGDRKTLAVPSQGEYVIDSDTGLVTFTPVADYNGTATPVQYRVTDNDGATATAIINLTVNDVNDPPVTEDDSSNTSEDTAIVINILDNDEDIDGTLDPTSVIFVNRPTGSILSTDSKTLAVPSEGEYVIDSATGLVTFTPVANYNGTPTPVQYQVTDNDNATDIGQINITVSDVNDPPVAVNDSGNISEDVSVTIDILNNDRDLDGSLDPTSVIFVNEPTGSTISSDRKTLIIPSEGEYVIDSATGEVTFTPVADYNGTPTTIQYQVTDDDNATDIGEINITVNDVNDPPVAVNDSGNTSEDTPVAIDILANDRDDDGSLDSTSVIFIDEPTGSSLSADSKTLIVPGEGEYVVDPATGVVTFTPLTNYNGTPTPVQYQVADDDGATTTAIINLTVDDVNDPPVAVNDSSNTPEDTPVAIDILASDRDPDGSLDPTSVVFINRPNGSTISSDRKTLTVPGEGEYVIDPATGLVTFTPVADYNGIPTPVEYRVADDDGATASAIINLTVDDVNDLPVAIDDNSNTPEDTAITINILNNDSDPDGSLDPTSVVFVNEPTGSILSGDRKTLTVPSQGEYVIDSATGLVTFTPFTDYNGTATPVEYQVTDDDGATDIGQISIAVNDVNDPPVAEDDFAEGDEDTATQIDILASDRDPDGSLDPTSVVFVNQPNGSILSSDRKTLTVPNEGEYVIDSATGLVTFTPVANYNGTPTPIEYQVSDDDGATASAIINLFVNDINDVPLATDDFGEGDEDTAIAIDILTNDRDVDGSLDPTLVVFVNQPTGSILSSDSKTLTVPQEGEYIIDSATGLVTFTPIANYNGIPTPVQYQVTDDDGVTDIAQINITVNDVNDPPVAEDDNGNTSEDTSTQIDILDNDRDVDGAIDPTSVVFINRPNGSSISSDRKTLTVPGEGEYVIDSATGLVTFTPITNYNGTLTPVEYRVADDDGLTASAIINLSVDDVNDIPIAVNDFAEGDEDTAIAIDILTNDSDIDGTLDPTSVVFINEPSGSIVSSDRNTLTVPQEGEYVINSATGEVTFTPVTDYNGTPTPIEYQVSDDDGLTASAIINLTLNDVNDIPLATDDFAEGDEDTAIAIDILDNDNDVDGTIDPTSVVFINRPNGSSISSDRKTLTVPSEGEYIIDSATGLVTFTPVANYNGTPTPIEYQIVDDDGATDIGQISITVNSVNDAPVVVDDAGNTDENTSITLDLLENDSDIDGILLTSSMMFVNPPENATLSNSGRTLTVSQQGQYVIDPNNGFLTFTSETDFTGTLTPVDYQVTDDSGAADIGRIFLTIDYAPVVRDDLVTTTNNTPVTFDPLTNDTTSNGTIDSTSVVFVNPPAGSLFSSDNKTLSVLGEGVYSIDPITGEITFTPEAGFTGTLTPVDYQVTDDTGTTDIGRIFLTVDDVPVVGDDLITTTNDTPVTFDPLTNDTTSNGTIDSTSVVFVNPPTGSTLTNDGKTLIVSEEGIYSIDPITGEITFTPETGFTGTLTPVEYQVTDDTGATDIGTIEISIEETTQLELYRLSGQVLVDTDNDNAFGSADTGIENVTLRLFAADVDGNPTGSLLDTAITDRNGFYEFTGVADDDYAVVEIQPAGYDDVRETDEVTDNKIAVAIAGDDSENNSFLEQIARFDISGAVFLDTDNSKDISGGDTGIEDVTLGLYTVDRNGNIIASPVATTTTNDTGFYEFTDLLNGDYAIVRDLDLDGDESNRIELTVDNTDSTGYDFLDELSELSGRVYENTPNPDNNRPLSNVEIRLFSANIDGSPTGDAIATTTTNENGFYRFEGLLDGRYVIIQTQPEGFDNITSNSIYSNRISVEIDGADIPNNDFLEVKSIDGTASPEVLIGTSISETISGYKGQDTITGGSGEDTFFYTETSDGVDTITDFTSGEDRIYLSQILSEELAYDGSDPIGDGFVVLSSNSVGTMIQIDFDSSGGLLAKDVVFLEGIDAANINPNTDLIF